MRHGRLFALALLVIAVAAVPLARARLDHVVTHEGFLFKPADFTVSGDGDLYVQHLRWSSWGGTSAVATGQAVEQDRSSHVEHFYPARVTLSKRAYCPNLRRTVYNETLVRILGPSAGVFGTRTAGRAYTCTGSWRQLP